ncbi:ATP-dependent helicase, partial [Micrococcus luteus]
GIPGLLDAEQVSALLRQRQAEQIQRRPRAQAAEPADVVDHRRMKELRSELSKTVSAWAARSGQPHGVIHNRLREISGGPAVAQASREQLEKRLSTLRGWFVGRT